MTSLFELLDMSARAGLDLQGREGAMPAGHNGPWNDPETPVRSTAHWANVFYDAYRRSGRQAYLDAALRACDYLIDHERRPGGATFVCRTPKPGKTQSNGLIGQAWAVEPLIVIGREMMLENYLQVAQDVLGLHPYSRRIHGWHVVEIDGTRRAVTPTLNQQVWLCAMICLLDLAGGERARSMMAAARDFVAHLPRLARLTEHSLFEHRIRLPVTHGLLARGRKLGRTPVREASETRFAPDELSMGYHSFVLFGLSLLRRAATGDRLARATGMKAIIGEALNAAASALWSLEASQNVLAFGYNPTGIEMAASLLAFSDWTEGRIASWPSPQEWVGLQMARHFNPASGLMDRNSPDPTVLASRIYEAVGLPDMGVRLDG